MKQKEYLATGAYSLKNSIWKKGVDSVGACIEGRIEVLLWPDIWNEGAPIVGHRKTKSDHRVNAQERKEIFGDIVLQFPSRGNVSENVLEMEPSVSEESDADLFVRQAEEDQIAELARFTLRSVSFMDLPWFVELASHQFNVT